MVACRLVRLSSAAFTPSSAAPASASVGTQRRALGIHFGFRLHRFHARQQLPLGYAIALFHQDFGELAHGVGANVDVLARLDLARRRHQADQILAHGSTGLDRNNTAFAVLDTPQGAATGQN